MKEINLNADWLFCLGGEWDEEKAQKVCLPHSVELTPEVSSGCRNYQGECIYCKKLWIPEEDRGKKLFLEFEGAMGVSELFLNGEKVKEHFCGYTPLVYDMGEKLKYGEENLIMIRLDNRDNCDVPPGKPQADLDFSYDGGLYRDVKLKVCDRLYITHPLLEETAAGGGIFVWYSDVTESHARVHFRVHVKNEHSLKKNFELKISLLNKDDLCVGYDVSFGKLNSGADEYAEGVINVAAPMLWSPETPNLYTLRAEILCDGQTIHTQDTEVGIRTFEFTLNDGVIFNGKSRCFHGANYHQTWPYIGNAVPHSLLVRDLIKIKSMGMDNIRSHYPFSTSFASACNHLGLTLIVSNIGWQFCRPGIFMERALQNMRDIIRWQRNNPCILLWEPILNESKMTYEVQLAFHEAVHEEYPYAPCYTASDFGPTDVAYKDYDPKMLGTWMEDYGLVEQKDDVERPKWVREYGDSPDDFFNQNSVWRCKRSWGDGVMAESVNRMLHRFDSDMESTLYLDVYNNKKLCGYGVWPVIAHNRGYHMNPCWGGHLDLFRVPKFSYYFMQAQKDREEIGDILYIANWWSETSPADVVVYSNAEKVQLYWNNQLIAEQYPDDVAVKHPPFTFKDVRRKYKTRERSFITAKALVSDTVVAEQTVKAPGVVNHMELEADLMGIPLKADGADIVAVHCYMKDADGTVVPYTADVHPILFEVEGEGEIVGDTSIGANPICAEAGVATVLIRSTSKPGEITVNAKMYWEQPFSRGIRSAELKIKSQPATDR